MSARSLLKEGIARCGHFVCRHTAKLAVGGVALGSALVASQARADGGPTLPVGSSGFPDWGTYVTAAITTLGGWLGIAIGAVAVLIIISIGIMFFNRKGKNTA